VPSPGLGIYLDVGPARVAAASCRLRPTPSIEVFAQAFAPEEARRILDRLEFHFTRKHASWLNVPTPSQPMLTSTAAAAA
jgi:hypothetical protein